MKTKPTQKEKIVALLSDGRWHSTIELHVICWRYGARLWDLRRDGYVFEKRRTADPRIEEWRLLHALDKADMTEAAHDSTSKPAIRDGTCSSRGAGVGARPHAIATSGNARVVNQATDRQDGQLSLAAAFSGEARP